MFSFMNFRQTQSDDPLSLALVPSIHETKDQRRVRERAQVIAQRANDEIEQQIARDREGELGKKRPIKVVLVGQSGSGKTAMMRKFHRTHAKEEWDKERASWRAVIYLNLVQGVNDVLEYLPTEMTGPPHGPGSQNDEEAPGTEFGDEYRRLRERLAPLKQVETELEKMLGVGTGTLNSIDQPGSDVKASQFVIDSSNTWKSVLSRASEKVEGEITKMIADSCADIRTLWNDSMVREVLTRRKAQVLETNRRFFLDDVKRIAAKDYVPTDDDVFHARLKTSGIREYKITLQDGQEWHFYDVGGIRDRRDSWHSYMDDANAIIFLAPLSTFNERLPEDKRINRLEDSYLLWRSVCSSTLLARVHIILFLNKCDILRAKLQQGIRIQDTIPQYRDRKNDLQTSIQYFQQHFKKIARQYSPVNRPFYVHITSATIDEKSIACALGVANETELPI